MDLQTKQAKTIMMTGASSLLGRGIIRSLPDNYQLVACYRNHKIPVTARVKAYKLDISNNYQTEKALEKIKPDLLIHAAALSNVDYCESHQNEAWMTNVQSTFKLVRLCEQSDIPIIFISTNAVFDGKKEVYKEDDQVSPLNFYGQTKAEGEKIVRKSQVPWIILRLITMYGWQPENARLNPVTWVLSELEAKHSIKVVDDVWLNPLYYLDGGQVIWKLIDSQAEGIWHVAGSETLSRYDWAKKTAQIFQLDSSLISPTSSSFFSGKIAPRPHRTIYSTWKLNNKLGYQTKNISEGLMAMLMEKKLPHDVP